MSISKNKGRAIAKLIVATLVLVVTISLGISGYGTVPSLGNTFNPFLGVWTMANNAKPPVTQTLRLPGLNSAVTVAFDANGVPTINASSDHDLFEAMGYIHAHFRLFEMDLLRREASGTLTQIVGNSALSNDELELTLGLNRTAAAEWKKIGSKSALGKDLLAYAAGVNYQISQFKSNRNLPAQFKLLKYTPANWTPIDSLLIEGDLTQVLDFNVTSIDYQLLEKSLGYTKTMALFPVVANNPQAPYDLGPYKKAPLSPITQVIPGTTPNSTGRAIAAKTVMNKPKKRSSVKLSATSLKNVDLSILNWVNSSQPLLKSVGGNSNNWVVDSTKSANGHAMIAGDPHLHQSLPSVWYQMVASSPTIDISGVGIPGLPGILIGHNKNIAWSLTNTQNQATFFYQEVTSPSRPGEYFWKSKWRKMNVINYKIPLRGGGYKSYQVRLTVHGPILSKFGISDSVYWTGALPSGDLSAMIGVWRSSNFSQFRNSLKTWLAPTQNFAYADVHGNIGIVAPGIYPQVKAARPWLPLSGNGSNDVVGTIPYSQVPMVYDPPTHFAFSANQREVTSKYPYYIGTSANFFSNGFRARTIKKVLSSTKKVTMAQMEALQSNNVDLLASEIVPLIKGAVASSNPSGAFTLSPLYKQYLSRLEKWNYSMDTTSSAATIWWYFLQNYMTDTFGGLWSRSGVPTAKDPNLVVGTPSTALVEDIEAASLHPSSTGIFNTSITSGQSRNKIIFKAFVQTVTQLDKAYGSSLSAIEWGKVHKREFVSLAQVKQFSYGPFPGAGDSWTVDAADGNLLSTAGPSWRMVGELGVKFVGIIPGGQSENPISPLYSNQALAWRQGRYLPMVPTSASSAIALWTLR